MTSAERVQGGGPQIATHPDRALVAQQFEAAVEIHYANLTRRLVVVLGNRDDAQDVAQETYLRAFRAWSSFDGGDVRAWLYTIALRLAFNERRRRKLFLEALVRRDVPAAWADLADPDLSAAVARLEPRTRAALLLNAVDGFTLREVGSMLGAPEGTVGSWVSRGRAVLRRDLGRP